jgi:hypothetical protein
MRVSLNYQDLSGNKFATVFLAISRISAGVLLRAKKVGHQISVSFEKFDVVQALLSFFLTLFQLTV